MIDLMRIEPGMVLRLVAGRTASVVENMGDGQWLMVRVLSAPEGDETDVEELCHAQDVLAVESKQPNR